MSDLAELENSIEYIVWLIDNRVEKIRAIERQITIWVMISSIIIGLLVTLGILILLEIGIGIYPAIFFIIIFIFQIAIYVLYIINLTKMKISNEFKLDENGFEMSNLSVFLTKLKIALPDYCKFLEKSVKKKQQMFLATTILAISQILFLIIFGMHIAILVLKFGSYY